MIGQTILGYHVDEKIGSGGFGTVYKVSKTNAAGTYVRALKHITLPTKKQYTGVLNSMGGDYSKADDYFAGILKDIVSEINILSMLSEGGTQNIVRYYENDIVETPSPKTYDIYILMEFLTPFPDHIENNPFTVRDVITLGKDILKALMDCHKKNIIHRDIKDDNIFVSGDGVYKLGDFGVSKALKDKSRAESMKGTPNFIAPEVYLGKESYDNTVDLYSLGIVLYKLLNKARNPFMPKYPAPYSSQDEDAAFEARMTGQVPELPVCAENILGQAILKAIMPRADRYNNAEEFYNALDAAEKALNGDDLSIDLGLSIPAAALPSFAARSQNTVGTDIHNNETIGSDALRSMNETVGSDIDRRLFETIGTTMPGTPNISSVTPAPTGAAPAPTEIPCVPSFPQTPQEPSWENYPNPPAPEPVKAIEKKDFKWLLYLSPFLIAGTWLIVYLILLPVLYGKAVSFIEWIINDPTDIIDALKDARNVFTPIYQIILLKVYNWLTLAGLITSLYFIGRSLHHTKPATNDRAKLCGKEPFLITTGVLDEVKTIGNKQSEQARKAIYALNERLKNESAFGIGADAVINCENEIAFYLNAIQSTSAKLYNEDTADQAAKDIEVLCQKCMTKLKIRIELKKR